jgi:hypothetical protein
MYKVKVIKWVGKRGITIHEQILDVTQDELMSMVKLALENQPDCAFDIYENDKLTKRVEYSRVVESKEILVIDF